MNRHEIRISRLFKAPPPVVFKAWSTAEHVKNWFCPSTYSVSAANVRMELGGPFEVCMRAPDGTEHWTRGRITELVPNTRLVISSEVGWRKPAPEFFAALCRSAGVPAECVLYVGDDPANDYAGAEAAGLRAVLLDRTGRGADAVPRRMERLADLDGKDWPA